MDRTDKTENYDNEIPLVCDKVLNCGWSETLYTKNMKQDKHNLKR